MEQADSANVAATRGPARPRRLLGDARHDFLLSVLWPLKGGYTGSSEVAQESDWKIPIARAPPANPKAVPDERTTSRRLARGKGGE